MKVAVAEVTSGLIGLAEEMRVESSVQVLGPQLNHALQITVSVSLFRQNAHVCRCLFVQVLRVVSVDKILRFTNTFSIIIIIIII